MPGSTNIQRFNPNADNQENDAAYTSESIRANGAAPGVFPKEVFNKFAFQISAFVSALAQALATKGYVIEDGSIGGAGHDFNALVTAMANIMTKHDTIDEATHAASSSACSGNAASSSACSGNAESASECSGNSATATNATNAANVGGLAVAVATVNTATGTSPYSKNMDVGHFNWTVNTDGMGVLIIDHIVRQCMVSVTPSSSNVTARVIYTSTSRFTITIMNAITHAPIDDTISIIVLYEP